MNKAQLERKLNRLREKQAQKLASIENSIPPNTPPPNTPAEGFGRGRGVERMRVPDDPCVKAFWELNRELRPGWERKVLAWASSNRIKLEGVP